MSPVDAYQNALTRRQVAELLGLSVSAVRHLEARGELHPAKLDGVWLFDRAEVGELAAVRPRPRRRSPNDELAAVVFDDFEAGRGVAQIVRDRGISVRKARQLKAAWLDDGELTARTLEYLDQGHSIEWIARRRDARRAVRHRRDRRDALFSDHRAACAPVA